MALTANREVDRYVDQELRSWPVAASEHIYKGAFVGLSSGYARALQAGDPFIGITYEEIDNSSGSNGDESVRTFTQGDFEHALSGAAVANNRVAIYASDDETLTTTSTDNSLVGYQMGVPASNKIVLRLQATP